VGAVRALLEHGIQPDMLVGTSIGAANATYLAMHGVDLQGVENLVQAWRDAAQTDLLPSNYLWLTLRVLFQRGEWRPYQRMREFFVEHGVSPDLRFADIKGARLILVAADLNTGLPVLYGADPQQSVLEGLLASTALPPWVQPIEKGEQLLIDGGLVSGLPIEPALAQGARSIIALDLADPRCVPIRDQHFGPFLAKVLMTVEKRQTAMEKALAEARHVPVHHIALQGEEPVLVWDFSQTETLLERGYEITSREMSQWLSHQAPWWRRWFS
jgi:NTE family protein